MKNVVKVITLLAIVFCFWSFTNAEKRAVDNGYKIGDVVTDFRLENIDGKMVSMENF